MMKHLTVILAFVMALSSQVSANDFFHGPISRADLSSIKAVRVAMIDDATGACWTNLRDVRTYAEEKLLSNGVTVKDNIAYTSAEDKVYELAININASRLYADGSGPCVGSARVELTAWTYVNGQLHRSTLGEYRSNTYAVKGTFNQEALLALNKAFMRFP